MKKLYCPFCRTAAAITLMCGTSAVEASILTTVPVQNYGDATGAWMIMPLVSYHADDSRLHVMVPAEVPQLTPLLVSNPGDSFDVGDPWFSTLDPSHRGESFSRRYGFTMNTLDPLPAGTEMWIRKLSGSAGLRLYRYSGSAPKIFEPIFGTDGVTNALYWSGMMFHPAVTAAAGTNNHTATFEIFLRDSATHEEVADSSTGPFGLNWSNVPDRRPTLALAGRAVVTWPAGTTTNWVLESAETLDAANWTIVTNAPVIVDDAPGVLLNGDSAQQFFRMRFVP